MSEIIVEFPSPLTDKEKKMIYGYKGEVVRCKDCKHWHESVCLRGEQGQRVGLCDCTMSMRDTDFFCKAGEKETEDG